MQPITYQPEVWDVRLSSDGSLDVLPLLGKDDWPKLYEFMKSHWPEFEIDGEFGEHRAKNGQRWWSIGAVEVKEGPALFQIQFRKDAMTYDHANILSVFSWEGADPLPPQFLDDPGHVLYRRNGVWSFSEGQDSKGYPYGGASGPYWIWLWSDPQTAEDRRVGSDCLSEVHWFDNHVSLNPVFWPQRKGDGPTGEMRLAYMENGVVKGSVALEPNAPPGGKAFVVLDDKGQVIGHAPAE